MVNICGRNRSKGGFILDLIGLSTHASRVVVFFSGFVVVIFVPTKNLNYIPIRSIYENVLHIKPYSSGMLRSLSMIAHGNLSGAWSLNKLSFIVFIAIIILLFKDISCLIKKRFELNK